MPADERLFSAPLPARIYLDCDIAVSYLSAGQSHHERSSAFVAALQNNGATMIYLSSLAWLELAHVVTRANFRHSLSLTDRRRFRLGRWELASVRERDLRAVMGSFAAVLDQLSWAEIPLVPQVRQHAVELMARYALGSQDAAHLARARAAGVADFASFDGAFRRVDGLILWNDRIHAPQPPAGH